MLNCDVAVAVGLLELLSLVNNRIEPLAEIDVVGGRTKAGLAGDPGVNLLDEAAHIHARLFQNAACQSLLGQQGGKQMLAFHLLLTPLLR